MSDYRGKPERAQSDDGHLETRLGRVSLVGLSMFALIVACAFFTIRPALHDWNFLEAINATIALELSEPAEIPHAIGLFEEGTTDADIAGRTEDLTIAQYSDFLMILGYGAMLILLGWALFRIPRNHDGWLRPAATFSICLLLIADCLENHALLENIDRATTMGAHRPDWIACRLVIWSSAKWLLAYAVALLYGWMAVRANLRLLASCALLGGALGILTLVDFRLGSRLVSEERLYLLPLGGAIFGLGLAGHAVLALRHPEFCVAQLRRGDAVRLEDANTDLIEEELGAHPSETRYGLALSGGGIRSATFNLGLLQALDRLGVLEHLHYVSTVSGGGYIGGFWTAWRKRNPRRGRNPDGTAEKFPRQYVEPGGVDPKGAEALEHLRRFGRFLIPRNALIGADTGRMFAAVTAAIMPALITGAAVIVLVLMAWRAASIAFIANAFVSVAAIAVVPGLILLARRGDTRTKKDVPAPEGASGRVDVKEETSGAYIIASLVVVVGSASLWVFLGWYHPSPLWADASHWFTDVGVDSVLVRFRPIVPWLFSAFLLVIVRLLLSSWVHERGHRKVRRLTLSRASVRGVDRVLARVAFLCTAFAVVGAVWLAAIWIREQGWTLHALVSSAGTGAGFAWVRRLFGLVPAGGEGSKLWSILRPLMPKVLANFTLVLAAVGIGGLVLPWISTILPAALAAIASVVGILLLEPNSVGLHDFYRSRISRAYLGASNQEEGSHGDTEERFEDDFPLTDIALDGEGRGPTHLICCCANDVAGDDLENLGRGSESAVLSHVGFSVGSEKAEWAPWPDGSVSLGRALTASAAAFNSLMGGKTAQLGSSVAFLMTALGLRLGTWLPHPRWLASGGHEWPVGVRYYREMFGLATTSGFDVHLSDGGHFENLAIYELLRRRCRFVIASDCGADPDVAFDDFGNLTRRARADFGVEIDIDLEPLKPRDDGLAKQYMVVGNIHYDDGSPGVLLYFKPTLVGGEPADITQYRERNRDFPHESTGDQFYDEAQWESYRRLGEHAVATAFEAFGKVESEEDLRSVFVSARYSWLPTPEPLESAFAALAQRRLELEAALEASGCDHLHWEIFPTRGQGGSPSAAPAASASLEPPTKVLPVLRRAALLMEEVYVQARVGETPTHPAALGWINYLARWAYAPTFRAWWPLLSTLHPSKVVSFYRRRFGLPDVSHLHKKIRDIGNPMTEKGEAIEVWRQLARKEALGDQRMVGLDLSPAGTNESMTAALLVYREEKNGVSWSLDDLFVPPGLWGVGIGSCFLSELLATRFREREILVHLGDPSLTAGGSAIRTDVELYLGRGFVPDAEHLRWAPPKEPFGMSPGYRGTVPSDG